MPLTRGISYLAIPGPSVMPEEVLRAMHRPAPDIYQGELIDITASLLPDLKRVAGTAADAAIYICNGHGTWEAVTSNVFSRGDRALVLATGLFGHGWADIAEAMGVAVERMDFGRQTPVDLARLEARLRADRDHELRAVMVTHVDTATSIRNDIAGIRALLDRLGHPALLLADCVASMAVDEFRMDDWGVDVAIAASQKGLMTPPGLGFVFFSARADAARARAGLVTPYWDWRPRARPAQFYQHFCGTAPTHHLYGLRAALDMVMADGIAAVWARHAALASAVWAAVEAWGRGGPLALNVAQPAARSHAVTTIDAGDANGGRIRAWVSENAGLTLGLGLGMAAPGSLGSERYFRIGHMGYVNAQMIMGALGAIEMALTALDIPHGPGALEAAAAALARA